MNMSMKKQNYVTAIILAAGMGSRMELSFTKQQLVICGESVLHRSLRAFDESGLINAIVVVCRREERDFVLSEARDTKKVISIVEGGNTRAESAKLGFMNIPAASDYVAIHDAARCLVTPQMIDSVVRAAFVYGAATAARKISDSIKRSDGDGFVLESVPRENLYAAQTPQIFRTVDYALGLEKCSLDEKITDDNMIIESTGRRIFCVECGAENIKITTPSDACYAEFLIQRRTNDE